jgi:hypothetical protein
VACVNLITLRVGGNMQKIIIAIMVLAFGLTVSQGAFARMKDNSNFGYCPDGTKVPDTTKCPKEKTKK